MTSIWSAPSGDLLAACCGGAVKVWSPENDNANAANADGARLPTADPTAASSSAVALDWSANNKVLAVAGDRPQVLMYGGGQLIGQVPAAGAATSAGGGNPSSAASALTAAGTATAQGGPALTGNITALRFGSDSKRMVVGCRSRAVHVLDLRQQGAVSRTNVDHRGPVCALAVAPGDAAVASAGEAGQLLLHDFRTAVRLATLEGGGGGGPAASSLSGATTGTTTTTPTTIRRSLAFSPGDAEQLAAAGDDGGVVLWALRSRSLRAEWRGLHGSAGATGVCWSSSGGGGGEVLFSVGRDRRLCVLDARAAGGSGGGASVAAELRALQPLTCVAARHDGALVAAGTSGGGVLVFDARALGRGALHAYAFGGSGGAGEPVREVRWQHAPSAGARARAAAAQARAVVADGNAASVHAAGAAAPGQLQPSAPAHRPGGYVLSAKEEQEGGASFGVGIGAAQRRQAAAAIGTAAEEDDAAGSYGGAARRRSSYYEQQQQQQQQRFDDHGGAAAGAGDHPSLLLPGEGGDGPLSPVRRGGAAPASPSAASSQPAPSFGQAPHARRPVQSGMMEDDSAASYQQQRQQQHQQQHQQEEEDDERAAWRGETAAAAVTATTAAAAAPSSRRQPALPPLALRRAGSQQQQQQQPEAAGAGASTTPRLGATTAAAEQQQRRAPSSSLTPPRAGRGGLTTPRGAAAAAAAAVGSAGLLTTTPAAATTAAGAALGDASGAAASGSVRAVLDDAVACLRADLRAVHVEVVRQAAAAQLDLASVVSGLAARQDALSAAVASLADRLDAALAGNALRPPGAGGVVPAGLLRASGGGDLASWLGH
jgi:hypothetical protein